MKHFFTLLIVLILFTGVANAQRKNVLVSPVGTLLPTIDGIADDAIWTKVKKNQIDRLWGNDGTVWDRPIDNDMSGYWQAAWSGDGLYILIVTEADDAIPALNSYGEPWEQERVQVYFDMNIDKLDDGIGNDKGMGHPIINVTRYTTAIQEIEGLAGSKYAIKVNTNFSGVSEFFVPWTALKDKNNKVITPSSLPIGFDVFLVDNDGPAKGVPRTRRTWSAVDEIYFNDDNSGRISFEGSILAAKISKLVKEKPTIDGIANDNIWSKVEKNWINKLWGNDSTVWDRPINNDMYGYWQAAWASDGLYILVTTEADDAIPALNSYGEPWEQERVQVYFDMNTDNLKDGIGNDKGMGHPIINVTRYTTPASAIEGLEGSKYAVNVNANFSGVAEFFVPWTALKDKNNKVYTPSATMPIGFDVFLVDNDGPAHGVARSRRTWCAVDEVYFNADNVGQIYFSENIVTKVNDLISSDKTFKIYPNPVANTLYFSEQLKFSIYDLTGKVIIKNETLDLSVNVSNLHKGIYLLKAVTADGNSCSLKFIKQ